MRINRRRELTRLALALVLVILPITSALAEEPKRPRLILQITVDALRGDLLERYYDRLGKGGLRYLLDAGSVYTNAHHRHANTETIVGHATLATGADPSVHGMVGNVWLDRTLAELLGFVDTHVGLDKTLIVLSADHGGPEAPGYLSGLGFEADYIDRKAIDKVGATERLKERFGIGEALITTYFHPYVYLNRKAIADKGLDQAEVERAVAEELARIDGVALAVSSSALRVGRVPDTPLIQSILRNYHPKRSGDIYVAFEPNRFINDFDGLTVATSHGSPWRYDSHVPIIFAGMEIPARRFNRMVDTVDIAPTLSLLVAAKPPTGSFGASLYEVMQGDP